MTTFNHLMNARHPRESFKNYRARRKAIGKAVKQILAGKLVYVACSPTQALPVAGVDAQIDYTIINRQIRHVTLVTNKDGTQFRIGLTKGVPYVHPSKLAHPLLKRAARRAIVKDWRRVA